MRVMKTPILIVSLIVLTGCAQPALQPGNDYGRVAENEKFLSECMASYTDLLQKYTTLTEQTWGQPPDDKELAGFITKYHDISDKHHALLQESGQIKSENKKLKDSQKMMQLHLKSMEDKLQRTQKTVSHLEDVLHSKPPQNNVMFTTNPKTNGIIFDDSLLFSAGKSKLSDEGKNILKPLADTLTAPEYKKFLIRVDGHTDSTPVRKTKSINFDNWFLGAKRAHQALAYLVSCGVDSSRLSLASFGANAPLAPNEEGEKGNPKNRRVEIVLIEKIKTN